MTITSKYSAITLNRSYEEIKKRLQNADIIVTDLDECLFPFYTQVLVAGEILVESIFNRKLFKYVPRLLSSCCYIFILYAISFGNIKVFSKEYLMKCFAFAMKGIPFSLIEKHSQYIHTFFYEGALTALNVLSRCEKVPVCIISLSIFNILDVLKKNNSIFTAVYGNTILPDSKGTFFSHYAEPLMSDNNDKEKAFHVLCENYSAKHPIVIGHSPDEINMVNFAAENNGVSIGINPSKDVRDAFDIVLDAQTWNPLVVFLNDLLSEED